MNPTISLIEEKLTTALSPTQLTIEDNAADHAGHANEGAGHFTLHITSPLFSGQTALARHHMVYEALGDLMQTHIHAVRIRAYAPGEKAR